MKQGFVFLTYASDDARRVRHVVEAMESRGLSVAWERFEGASEIGARAQRQALDAADIVLVLWSRHALTSRRVLEEAGRARSRGVLMQAALDGASVPMPFVLDGVVTLADPHGLSRLLEGLEQELRGQDGVPEADGPVQFTLSGPPTVAPGAPFVLELWAHGSKDRDEVVRRALEPSRPGGGGSRASSYTVRLAASGLSARESEVALGWDRGIGAAQLLVTTPADASTGSRSGSIGVYVLGFRVARVHFAIQVGEMTAEPEILPSRQDWHRSAFACYAAEDGAQVRGRLSALERAMPKLVVYTGSLELPTREEGLAPLLDHISERDVFYLFWSAAAAASQRVEREWRYAMRLRGRDFVETIGCSQSPETPLPPELARPQPRLK
jgi:hypothetical protein